jgi:acetyl esterase
LEECYDVISYVTSTESAKKLRVDPTRVALGGDSAGGNLTIAVTCKMNTDQTDDQ